MITKKIFKNVMALLLIKSTLSLAEEGPLNPLPTNNNKPMPSANDIESTDTFKKLQELANSISINGPLSPSELEKKVSEATGLAPPPKTQEQEALSQQMQTHFNQMEAIRNDTSLSDSEKAKKLMELAQQNVAQTQKSVGILGQNISFEQASNKDFNGSNSKSSGSGTASAR